MCFNCGVSGLCSDSNHRALIHEYCDCIVDALNKSTSLKYETIGNNVMHRSFN